MPERWKQHPVPDAYYTRDDLKALAAAIGKEDLDKSSVQALHSAALGYVACFEIERKPEPDDDWPPHARLYGRSARRAALEKIKDASIKLKDALEDGLPKLLVERQDLTEIDLALLEKLAEEANSLREEIPGKGSDPERARRQFVSRLGSIYLSETGTPPPRRHNPVTAKDYGPFHDFVRFALGILNEQALRGIDDIIAEIIADMGNLGGKTSQ